MLKEGLAEAATSPFKSTGAISLGQVLQREEDAPPRLSPGVLDR